MFNPNNYTNDLNYDYTTTNDLKTRKYAMQMLQSEYPSHVIKTFKDEEGGPDLTFNGHPFELKTRRRNHDDALWTASDFSYYNIPRFDDTNYTFENKLSGEHFFDEVSETEIPTYMQGLDQLYFLKAETGQGEFLGGESVTTKYWPKWKSITTYGEGLMVMCKDGYWILKNSDLMDRFIGYARYREQAVTSYRTKYGGFTPGNNPYHWYIVALLDFAGLEFRPRTIPRDVFRE